jgi:hypothetical protein
MQYSEYVINLITQEARIKTFAKWNITSRIH